MRAALVLSENVGVHGQDCPGIISEILRDLMHRSAEPQPRRRGIVAQVVSLEAQRKLADNAYGELVARSVGEEVVVKRLTSSVLLEDLDCTWGIIRRLPSLSQPLDDQGRLVLHGPLSLVDVDAKPRAVEAGAARSSRVAC